MSKSNKGAAMSRLHSVARLARTTLAARLLAHGFYAGQDQIMLSLHEEDGQTPGQLAARLGVRPPTITKTINRLQAQGFLEKRASDTDARQAHIFLTEVGHNAIRAVEKSVKKTEKQALKGFDKKDVKQLSKLLIRIEANLSDVDLVDDETGAEADPAADAEHELEAEAAE
ncbi:MarR family winged helix-turn-helix transcriptional regulator [Aminobacter sp. Piv2-1]|uniref:MarR family winged helix-turn-helix transcriptional regulator n=1 Tax=Aminobacter sp. Piv2-1 TaxID=3031122 RepID=UPI0030AAC214